MKANIIMLGIKVMALAMGIIGMVFGFLQKEASKTLSLQYWLLHH